MCLYAWLLMIWSSSWKEAGTPELFLVAVASTHGMQQDVTKFTSLWLGLDALIATILWLEYHPPLSVSVFADNAMANVLTG